MQELGKAALPAAGLHLLPGSMAKECQQLQQAGAAGAAESLLCPRMCFKLATRVSHSSSINPRRKSTKYASELHEEWGHGLSNSWKLPQLVLLEGTAPTSKE